MNNLSEQEINKLRELEESLWKSETRFDHDYMNKIMTDDFFEFGRSGKSYTKTQSLSAPMQEINAKFPFKNFQIHPVANDVVLITYLSEVQYEELEVGNRSSIWIKQGSEWRLRFHQGTPTYDQATI